jgi:hypothetical protein
MAVDTPAAEDERGFAQIPRWLQRSDTVSAKAKLVYLALSSRADRQGQSYPSHETLAGEASCSVASVKRALLELRDLGVVEWTFRTRDDGSGQTSNIYKVSISVPVDNSPKPVAHSELPAPKTVERVAHHELGGSSQGATNESQINEDLNKSSVFHGTHVTGAVDNSGDDDRNSRRPNPSNIRHHKAGIDWSIVLEHVPAFTHFAPDDLHTIGAEILARAASKVVDQTAYVARALHNDPFEWEQQGYAIDAARASRGGNPF